MENRVERDEVLKSSDIRAIAASMFRRLQNDASGHGQQISVVNEIIELITVNLCEGNEKEYLDS